MRRHNGSDAWFNFAGVDEIYWDWMSRVERETFVGEKFLLKSGDIVDKSWVCWKALTAFFCVRHQMYACLQLNFK